MQNILLIEDEQNVAGFIIQGLEEEGYVVTHVNRHEEAMVEINKKNIDLIILDILLPGVNGLDICKNLRSQNYKDIPILIVSALGSPENVVLGLDSGADDYLSKPFKIIELKARIRSLIRRKKNFNIQEKALKYTYKFLTIDEYKKIAYCFEQELNLTSTEYRLLILFVQNPQKVFNRSELLEKVWGINFDIGSNVVDVYVNYLRKKIEKITTVKAIQTVIGMGYVLKIED